MYSNEFIEKLNELKQLRIETVGLPNSQEKTRYYFSLCRESDGSYCVYIPWNSLGRDQIPINPIYPEQYAYLSQFGISDLGNEMLMFNSLSSFENFLKAILPHVINKF